MLWLFAGVHPLEGCGERAGGGAVCCWPG